ncbi:hypothetical protein PVK06_039834 [Gossypium arboreum]|uniref:Putative plant transposon protein domain-containing protein n=1 Tax=Gossypium arboreum TaxID=29729 RepID=A0ABR0N4K1_GOSAR|nr:hypothetical protein PVK06_039834 [Gossypium arboreum]
MPISHSSIISMERMFLLYAIMTERSINIGKIILKETQECVRKNVGSAYFPSLITSLCLRAQVKSKANLKGHYVQGCIIRHDLERLVENVELLNQIEPNEPNESKSNESSTKSDVEADSVNEIEEAEFEEEPNSLEPRVEPNVAALVEPSVNPKLTITVPTSPNTIKKL